MYLIYLYIYVKYIIKLYFCIVNLNARLVSLIRASSPSDFLSFVPYIII